MTRHDVNSDEIIRLYCDEKKSTKAIGRTLNCSSSLVVRRLKSRNVRMRTRSEVALIEWSDPEYRDKWLAEAIPRLKSPESIEKNRKGHVGIPVPEDAKRRLSEMNRLDKHPQWKGGLSFEPYCEKFNEGRKEAVRDKFGRRCYLCGCPENGKRLHVHHADYNKKQGCGRPWALIPLCVNCHTKNKSQSMVLV